MIKGYIYSGPLLNDLPHGFGVQVLNSSTYEGEFENGVRCGVGTLKYNSGLVFEGHWSEDKKNGEGRLIYSDGHIIEGTWNAMAEFSILTRSTTPARSGAPKTTDPSMQRESTLDATMARSPCMKARYEMMRDMALVVSPTRMVTVTVVPSKTTCFLVMDR